MGEFADDAIDRGMYEESIEDFIYNEDGNCPTSGFNIIYTINCFFLLIKVETNKAWLLVLLDGTEHWFPKKCCIIKEHYINIPVWLHNRIQLDINQNNIITRITQKYDNDYNE